MREEVNSAAKFVANLLKCRNGFTNLQLEKFHQSFFMALCTHYQDHWFPEKPFKGSGFRCIRINHNMDPIIARAGCASGLAASDLLQYLPKEMTIWVDPKEVSYRFGEDGSIGIIYDESTCERSQSLSSGSDSECCSDDDNTSSASPSSSQSMVFEQNQDIFRACRDQLRHMIPDSSTDALSYDYFSTFVAS